MPLVDDFGGIDAVLNRHADVHQYYIRHEDAACSIAFLAIARLADYLEIRLLGQESGQTLPHHRMVVSEQDSDFSRAWA